MNPFFIASLPRSRTAWLANFLTYQESFCYHEPMNKTKLQDYPFLLRKPCKKYVGVSDSMNSLVMDQLIELFPDARIVVIWRDVAQVEASLNRLGMPCPGLIKKIAKELDRIVGAYEPLVVEYDAFDPAAIWDYLMPEIPLDYARLDMLNEFNVTVPPTIIRAKGEELMVNAGELLWPLVQ
jgi:hypothetical protein